MKIGTPVVLAVALLSSACSSGAGVQDLKSDKNKISVVHSETTLEKIGVGSCLHQDRPQPIWETVFDRKPDLMLMIGDNVYANALSLQEKYEKAFNRKGYKKLLREYEVLATYDDHDFGNNDSDKTNEAKKTAVRLSLDSFKVPKDDPRRSHEGVYGSYIYGKKGQRLQIILLDTRYFKDSWKTGKKNMKPPPGYGRYIPDGNPSKTILGKDQWAWLEKALKEKAEVRLVVSSIQVISNEHGRESWGGFPVEREKLFTLIKSTGAKGVILLSGDVHFSELSLLQDFAYPLYDFTSSAMAHRHNTTDGSATVYSEAINRFRVPDFVYTAATVGEIQIDWKGKKTSITLRILGVENKVVATKEIMLSELQ